MRKYRGLPIAGWAFGAMLALTGVAHGSVDSEQCQNEKGYPLDAVIESCSALLRAGADDKNRAILHRSLGIAYRKKGDLARAEAEFGESIRLDPKNLNAYVHRALLRSGRKDFERAMADAAEALRIDPKSGFAYAGRSLVHENKGDLVQAMADAKQSLRLAPDAYEGHLARANTLMTMGDHDGAIADYDRCIAIGKTPDQRAQGHFNRGLSFSSKRDYDRAIADFSEAIRLNLGSKAYYWRGVSHQSKKDYDRALADINEAIRLNPTYSEALTRRGAIHSFKDDHDRAMADFNEAIRLDPKDSDAYLGRADYYWARGDDRRGLTDLDEGIRQAANPKALLRQRGMMRLYGGSPALAVPDLTRAVELDPKDAYNALWLEIALRRSGQPGRLAQTRGRYDLVAWPGPLLRTFLGELTPLQSNPMAKIPPEKELEQACESSFYLAEFVKLAGKDRTAAILYRNAFNNCPKSFIEYRAAQAALRWIGETP